MTGGGDMPAGAEMILACRPVVSTAYRQRLVSLGLDPKTPELTPAPASGSTVGTCDACHAAVWVGPRQRRLRDAHTCALTVLCLLCAWERAYGTVLPGDIAVFGSLGGE